MYVDIVFYRLCSIIIYIRKEVRKLNVIELLQNLLCSLVAGLIIELVKLSIKGAPKLKDKKAKEQD